MKSPAKVALVLVALLAAPAARGSGFDGPALLGVSWELAYPLLDLRDARFDTPSAAGAGAELRFSVARPLTVGLASSWSRLSAKPSATLDAVTARLTAHLYLSRSVVQPYLGVGAGGVWRRADAGTGAVQNGFGLAADPQLGLLVTIVPELALDLQVRYQLTTGSLPAPWGAQNPSWLAVHVGLVLY